MLVILLIIIAHEAARGEGDGIPTQQESKLAKLTSIVEELESRLEEM